MNTASYFAIGIVWIVIGISFLLFAIISLGKTPSVPAASHSRWRRHRKWVFLLALAVVFIGGGAWFCRSAYSADTYYVLEVQAVATTSSGDIYLITPLDNALRCVVATECVEIQAGDHVLYHPHASSRNGIVDVHKG